MFASRSTRVSTPVRRLALVAVLCLLPALAGCKTSSDGPDADEMPADPVTTGSVNPQDANIVENTQKWAKHWEANPEDSTAAMSYAAHLRALKKDGEALAVLRKTAMSNPEDTQILAAYGKQLAIMRQFPEANKVLYKATATGTPSWETLSLHGTVLDRLGKQMEARQRYEAALKASPDNPKVLNNLAMSYAIAGSPKKAERLLLKAIATPEGRTNAQVQHNLALVLALQGDFDRARKVLSKVLPAGQVEANIAYVRKMISQRNTWQQIQESQPEHKG